MRIILGVVRHIITFAGGTLITARLAPSTSTDEFLGAGLFLIGIIWSTIDKKGKPE